MWPSLRPGNPERELRIGEELMPLQCNGKYSGIYTITPTEDVLEDIKAFSGGTIRDIRIPK